MTCPGLLLIHDLFAEEMTELAISIFHMICPIPLDRTILWLINKKKKYLKERERDLLKHSISFLSLDLQYCNLV